MKVCSKCKDTKPYSSFSVARSKKDGHFSRCKKCVSKYYSEYRKNNKDKITKVQKDYRVRSAAKISAQKAEYRSLNLERVRESRKKSYEKHKQKVREYQRSYYEENRESVLARSARYYFQNSERIQKQRSERKELRNEYLRERRKAYPLEAIKNRVRARVSGAIRSGGYKKNSKTCEIIGCERDKLKSHIESQFEDGMSWENIGDWHIDHIVPIASAKNENDLIGLFHFTNMQPLWAEENIKKGKSHPIDWAQKNGMLL